MNQVVGVRHLTGSAYHPQSQGQFERLHRTLNQFVLALVGSYGEDWEAYIPFEAIVRIVPLKVLRSRSPYEVVTGLRPKPPAAFDPTARTQYVRIDEYVDKLRQYLHETSAAVMRVQRGHLWGRGPDASGHLGLELNVGDLVLVRREPVVSCSGPLWFQDRTYQDSFRMKRKSDRHTFEVECVVDPAVPPPMKQPLRAEHLVKLDLPEMSLEPGPKRELEVQGQETNKWQA